MNSLANLEWLMCKFREGLICKTNRAWEIVSQINIMVRRADDGMRWHSLLGTKEKKGPRIGLQIWKGLHLGLTYSCQAERQLCEA